MRNMLEEVKDRYIKSHLPESEEARTFRADVGYLLSRLSEAENALRQIKAITQFYKPWDDRNEYSGGSENKS